MKNLLIAIALSLSVSLTAQVAVFHPVKIPQNQIEKFLEVETNYSQKVAQDAVNKGNLVWWALMKSFNTTADDYNYMWVNVYKDIDATVAPSSNWWTNSEDVVGVKPQLLYDGWSGGKADRRYFYQIKQQIDLGEEGKFVIFNFASPKNIDKVISDSKNYVAPRFKKVMKSAGMTGWGYATKITPQGENYASFMTYDAFDSMSNLMKHLSGEGAAMKSLDLDKLERIDWESRYVLEIVSSTSSN